MPDLLSEDQRLLWHPYSPAGAEQFFSVIGAEGAHLHLVADRDQHGRGAAPRRVVDAMSSWWAAVHGYAHPELNSALNRQAEKFAHVMFGGLTHSPAVELAEQLTAVAPEGLSRVFLADSGSVSVEVALKIAYQYQAAAGRTQRNRVIALRGGYHGDTIGAMATCDPVDGMHAAFDALVPKHVFAPRPPAARRCPETGEWQTDTDQFAVWAAEVRRLASDHRDELTALIAEPVLQGAGGMHIYHPEALQVMRQVCNEYGLLLIFDEIATGFGRTGTFFAAEWAGVSPDVMCIGKALTGGTMTAAAVLVTDDVASTVSTPGAGMPGALLHGPTFMANPLACAVSLASLKLLHNPQHPWPQSVSALERSLHHGLSPARRLHSVADVRVLGGVGVVELHEPVNIPAVTRAAVDRGAWVRPFRRAVYTMPPYICDEAEVATITAAICGAVEEVHG